MIKQECCEKVESSETDARTQYLPPYGVHQPEKSCKISVLTIDQDPFLLFYPSAELIASELYNEDFASIKHNKQSSLNIFEFNIVMNKYLCLPMTTLEINYACMCHINI